MSEHLDECWVAEFERDFPHLLDRTDRPRPLCICPQLRAVLLRAYKEGYEAGKAAQQQPEYKADIIPLTTAQAKTVLDEAGVSLSGHAGLCDQRRHGMACNCADIYAEYHTIRQVEQRRISEKLITLADQLAEDQLAYEEDDLN